MENGLSVENKSNAMGATSNNAAKLAVLQERKKQLEDSLTKKTQELKQLCIQEAELTGVTPPEMPLKAGESMPLIRRCVGTAYQLNANLVQNANKDELIADIELQIQLHAKLAEAALGLSNDSNISKTVKRKHNMDYRKHKSQCSALQEKLALLKEQQLRLKKKSKQLELQDDNISVSTVATDGPLKPESTHTLRSLKAHSVISSSDVCPGSQYNSNLKNAYRNSEIPYMDNLFLRSEDALDSGFYRLSLNGYNTYMERFEGLTNSAYNRSSHYNSLQSPNLHYNLGHPHTQSMSYNNHAHTSQQFFQHSSPILSQHSPHLSESNLHISQHSPLLSHHSPHMSHQHSPQLQRNSPQLSNSPTSQHSILQRLSHSNYNGMNMNLQNMNMQNRELSPTASLSYSSKYYPSHGVQSELVYRQPVESVSSAYKNPNQLQPHQQYEHNGMSSGLGGCWKRSESGEMFWCNSTVLENSWQKDKRFGSLDRRKQKKVHKDMSSVDNRCATIGGVPSTYQNPVRNTFVNKLPQVKVGNRRSQDHGQLVRTQSLGSVGAQTIDSVYPSDDNSSCESDNKSLSGNRFIRKPKEKEWLETSLDGPISPTHSIASYSQPIAPTVLAPEEKYTVTPTLSHTHPPPLSPKMPLEIPAESNPSPRIPETNFELFNINNNIPKNCTIVQAGQCKPYHEETKPFEMSDFYKYSTKFKKSPVKTRDAHNVGTSSQSNLNVEIPNAFEESFQQVKSPQTPQHLYNSVNNNMMDVEKPSNLNVSIDLSHIGVSENFSAEMNAWYNEHEDANSAKNNRSTATLV